MSDTRTPIQYSLFSFLMFAAVVTLLALLATSDFPLGHIYSLYAGVLFCCCFAKWHSFLLYFSMIVALVGLIHWVAATAIPEGQGFAPHPWYLAAPGWLKPAIRFAELHINLYVSLALIFLMPVYLLSFVTVIFMGWRATRSARAWNTSRAEPSHRDSA